MFEVTGHAAMASTLQPDREDVVHGLSPAGFHRLAYADWLEERGDPRAEVIRVHCRLAGLGVRDPEHSPLQARSHAILD